MSVSAEAANEVSVRVGVRSLYAIRNGVRECFVERSESGRRIDPIPGVFHGDYMMTHRDPDVNKKKVLSRCGTFVLAGMKKPLDFQSEV